MRLLQAIANQYAHIKHEAGELLGQGQHSQDEPTPSTPRAKQAEVHDLTVDPSEPPSPTESLRKFRTTIIPAILEEDDREHVDNTQDLRIQRKNNKPRRVSAGQPAVDILTRPSTRVRDISSPEEKRVLGEAEPVPKDAVRVHIPGSQSPRAAPSMPGSRKPVPFRPVNTLEQARGHTQGHTIRKHDLIPYRKEAGRNKPEAQQQPTVEALPLDVQVRPAKRRRIDVPRSSEAEIPEVIDIDSPEDDIRPHEQSDTRILGKRISRSLKADEGHNVLYGPGQQVRMKPRQPLQDGAPDSGMDQKQQMKDDPWILNQQLDYHPTDRQIANGTRNFAESSSHTQMGETKAIKPANRRSRVETGIRTNPTRYAPADDSPDELHSTLLTGSAKSRRNPSNKGAQGGALGQIPGSEQLKLRGHMNRDELKGYELRKFPLLSYMGREGPDHARLELILVEELKWLWVFVENPSLGDESVSGVRLSDIIQVLNGKSEVACHIAGGSIPGRWLFLGFQSPKTLCDFLLIAQPFLTGTTPKQISETEIAKRITHGGKIVKELHERQISRAHTTTNTAQSRPVEKHSEGAEEMSDRVKRRRIQKSQQISDSPDSPDPLTVITSVDRAAATEEHSKHSDNSAEATLRPRRVSKTTNTRSEFFGNETTARQTRSQVVRRHRSPSSSPISQHQGVQVTNLIKYDFQKPLTIHGPQKKRESLTAEDVDRLNDNEFLNDNVISFFLLFLQNQIHADQLKRMHFFNTFFFSTLTKDARGRNSISYDSVSRWTKNVNLFSRDFVIVPVNENLHWYVMIICNLPALKRIAQEVEDGDSDTIEETSPSNRIPLQEITEVLDVPSPETTRESFQELSLEDESVARKSIQYQTPKRKTRKASRTWSAKKYDPKKPVIITLDSLGQSRSSTAGQLKKYIVALAADPNQNGIPFTIDANSIPGMTAKGIPQQSNFSDCGLFLCMYLEQFMSSPDSFVYKILQRDGNRDNEFRDVAGHDLRIRFVEMVNDLAEQQHGASSQSTTPKLGSILSRPSTHENDDEKFSTLPAQRKPSLTHASIVDANRRWRDSKESGSEHQMKQHSPLRSEKNSQCDESGRTGTKQAVGAMPPSSKLTATKSRFWQQSSRDLTDDSISNSVSEVSSSKSLRHRDLAVPDTPALLAARMARVRSPDKFSSTLDDKNQDEIERIPERSNSVSTDFLVENRSWGLETYKSKHASPDLEPTPSSRHTGTEKMTQARSLHPTQAEQAVEISAADDKDPRSKSSRFFDEVVMTGPTNLERYDRKNQSSDGSTNDHLEEMLV